MILTLITINILVVFNFLTETSIKIIEEKLDVSVFFLPEVEDAEVLAIKQEFEALPQTKSVEFISREQRVQDFQSEYADNPEIIDSVNEIDENPFGSALVIKTHQTEDYDIIVNILDQERYAGLIEEKDYKNHQEVISTISNITGKARRTGEIMSVVFAIIAILIVFNTIRVAIYTHKEEIAIMKTVGAANWFVKFPFVVQSILYSVVALVFMVLIWYAFLRVADQQVQNFFGSDVSLLVYFRDNFMRIFGTELAVVIVLTILSSSVALRRYLKS